MAGKDGACPKCGAPTAPGAITDAESNKRAFIFTGVLVLLVILVMVVIATGTFDPEPPKTKKSIIVLNASAQLTTSAVVITNNDNFPWTNVEVTIFAEPLGGASPDRPARGYTCKIGGIPAGQSCEIPFAKMPNRCGFPDDDGRCLDTTTMKPRVVQIFGKTPNGDDLDGRVDLRRND
jgi:hypothetical protein